VIRRRLKILAVAVVLAAAMSSAAAPQASGPAWAAQVDRVFQAWDRADSPGCALGVFQNGQIAYAHGYGSADLEHDAAITPGTVFYVGSLSKQFTAMAVALAIQQGALAYDDSIRKYLPELPAYADDIKVSHLLHHTSGLRDYNTLLSIAGRRGDEAYDNRIVLAMMARQKGLNFKPGDEYLYSNTGYTLLATIVERATKTPFAAFAEAKIFKPLGMTVTHYHVDSTRIVKGRAMAYEGTQGAWTLDTPSNERAGAGGLYTNIPDLLRWDENFYSNTVGGAEVVKRLQTPAKLNDGMPLKYAWGLEVDRYRGLPIVEHGGSLGGYRAHLLRFPGQHTSVAILCNLGTITPLTLARRVAEAVLADKFPQPEPTGPTQSGGGGGRGAVAPRTPVENAADFTGVYYSDEIDSTFEVMAKDGTLILKRDADATPIALLMTGADEFRARGGLLLHFERDAQHRITGLTVDAGRVRDVRFVRRAPK
jgi:CubicO group peptidase (beta-lactamase class C family)